MQRERLPGSQDGEELVSFFIPSVVLKGSRDDKLRRLDTLIVYLERLRGRLADSAEAPKEGVAGPGRFAHSPSWPWFAAGALVSGLFALLFILARYV